MSTMKNLLAILRPVILCLSASAQRVTEVTPDTVGKQHHFGFSVGLSGDFAMIGAYADSRQNVYHRGIVYVYREAPKKFLECVFRREATKYPPSQPGKCFGIMYVCRREALDCLCPV